MKILITEQQLLSLINETYGEMEKHYLKTGILDDKDKDIILAITHGDNFTKLIADMYKYIANKYTTEYGVTPREINSNDIEYLQDAYDELKSYDKNLFPLKDLYAKDYYTHPLGIRNDLRTRRLIINKLKKIPSIYLRNLRNDIRRERNEHEFRRLWESITALMVGLQLLDRVKEDKRQIVLNKIFSSENDTFEKVKERLEKTTLPYLSEDSTKEDIISKVEDMGDEAEILHNENSILIVLIKSSDAMSYIGCSSQWCFARNSNSYWEEYASNGYATIIFNFDEDPTDPKRMVVVLDSGDVYNMYNEYMEDGQQYLLDIGAEQFA